MAEKAYRVWKDACPECGNRTYTAHGLDLRGELSTPALAGRRCKKCHTLSYQEISRQKRRVSDYPK